jgi:hypothetical protein
MYAPFLMKALWQFETMESSKGANLLARSLENILAMLWMRLMGL